MFGNEHHEMLKRFQKPAVSNYIKHHELYISRFEVKHRLQTARV
jgi:hypothetical protein